MSSRFSRPHFDKQKYSLDWMMAGISSTGLNLSTFFSMSQAQGQPVLFCREYGWYWSFSSCGR